jgi:ATP-binding cassette subfamily B protein
MARKKEAKKTAVDTVDVDNIEIDEFADAGQIDVWGEGAPPRKAKHFWPSAKRLVGLLSPYKLGMSIVFVTVVAGVVLSVIAPRILGRAVDVIVQGVASKNIPEGTDVNQMIEGLRAADRYHPGDRNQCRAARRVAADCSGHVPGCIVPELVLGVDPEPTRYAGCLQPA